MATDKSRRVREFTFYRWGGPDVVAVLCGHHAALEEANDETIGVGVSQTIGESVCDKCAADTGT